MLAIMGHLNVKSFFWERYCLWKSHDCCTHGDLVTEAELSVNICMLIKKGIEIMKLDQN